jgi:ribosomal-protein-serine acetyltransferase
MRIKDEKVSQSIELQLISEDLAEALFFLVNESRAHLSPWFPWVAATKTAADSLEYIQKISAAFEKKEAAGFLIRYNGEPVGTCGLHFLDSAAQHSQIGYWLGEKWQGKGIAHKAVQLIINYFFANYARQCLEIRCLPHNIRSGQLALRLGFSFQQNIYGECVGHGIVAHDVYMFTRTEWSYKLPK